MSKKFRRVVATTAVLLLALIAWLCVDLYSNIPKSPELALKSFYEREVAEDQIMDPLILSGPGVIPLLQKELTNPGMTNRRYAIGALGNLGNKSALPILGNLASKKSEIDYIRCDALVAIGMIDYQEGLRVTNNAREEGLQCLSGIKDDHDYARWLKSNAPRRTYLQALLGRHG